MNKPPEEVLKAAKDLEASVAKLRELFEKHDDSRPAQFDEALHILEADFLWVKGVTKRWLRISTRRGY